MTKSYAEQTVDERIASLDKIQNVLLHADWPEMYLRFSDDARRMQEQMDNAPDWDTFVAARAVKLYVTEHLMKLRDQVEVEKADLEAGKAFDEPLPPTDYELE